jgi:flavin reductase (DIM6/NTAB) family NADH-FMN oxidoreductase RutF
MQWSRPVTTPAISPTHALTADTDAARVPASRPVTPDEFKSAFRAQPGGVALITATGPGGHVALTATSVTSVSAEPPLLVFSVSDLSSSTPTILAAESVVVHLLAADDLHLARLGATSGIDRFADRSLWRELETGEPVFSGTRWLRSIVVDRLRAGTATLIIAQPVETGTPDDGLDRGPALVYHDRTWHRLGEHSALG